MTKLLEVAIGVATVMLLVSMSVTVITQFVLTILNQRGRDLVRGIGELIHQLDPSLEPKVAAKISTALLRHPLLRGNLHRAGDVIHRDELAALLMDLGSGTGSFGKHPLQATAASILAKNGITDPAQTLDNVRTFSMQLEAESPELATHVRQSMAILRAAESKYVAKINAWFDQTIDRVSGRFTSSTRAITIVVGLIVAFTLQLDTIELVDRLFVDDDVRAKLIDLAPKVQQSADSNSAAAKNTSNGGANPDSATTTSSSLDAGTQATTAGAAKPPSSTNAQNSTQNPAPASKPAANASGQPSGQNVGEYYAQLSNAGLISLPSRASFSTADVLQRLPGVLLSALLLSLGAPFWYNTLSTLLRLRSPSAQKDDQQRTERQASQAATAGAAGSSGDGSAAVAARVRFPIMPSEQGDLNAVG